MISIIIVGYNSKNDLKECFDSVYKSSYKDFEVIYVDNDSSDGSREFVKRNYPKITLIKNINNGYAGGNNVGIKQALKTGSEYIFLLNPDTTLDKDCLSNLLNRATKHQIVQPLILLNLAGKNTNLVNTSGSYLNFLGFSYCNDYKLDKKEIQSAPIGLGSGAAVLIPAQAFKKIGFLDENFFMYHEDIDWFYRARLNGYKIFLETKSLVYHKYFFSKNKKKLFYSERNRIVFLYKNFSLKYLVLIFPSFLLNELLVTGFSIISGWFPSKFASSISAIKLIGRSRCQRVKNLPKIRLRESELISYIGPTLSFSEVKNPLFTPYNFVLKLIWKFINLLI